ncbi:MAG: ring-cleaving dioxygenase [Methylobacterium mesophilicum]|nr:ring-cleaving dioxygenase [Methylobacterium mesophilicum]
MGGLIEGLHHVTLMAKDARRNNRFYTNVLGLRRVKQTVNFDAPDVYHLYYADGAGTPGTVMTFFPFPNIARGTPGVGEASRTSFSVPEGSLPFWRGRLAAEGVETADVARFGEAGIQFRGPDGEGLSLVERAADTRAPWTGNGIGEAAAIRGFQGVTLLLRKTESTAAVLQLMGYREEGREGSVTRFRKEGGNGADVVDLEQSAEAPFTRQGAGSVHHIAFATRNAETQARMRDALVSLGAQVTPSIDRDYFRAIYFRTPGGVLFEVATNDPGFARDEAFEHLGEALKLPHQHEHLRPILEKRLEPLDEREPVA